MLNSAWTNQEARDKGAQALANLFAARQAERVDRAGIDPGQASAAQVEFAEREAERQRGTNWLREMFEEDQRVKGERARDLFEG